MELHGLLATPPECPDLQNDGGGIFLLLLKIDY